jgi:Flp pilus assembly pilin Flp
VRSLVYRVWKEDEGVLTFEWILLITILAIGIVGGLSAVRDAIISELGDVSAAIASLDQSYTILMPMEVRVHTDVYDGASDSYFDDDPEFVETCRSELDLSVGETSDYQGVGLGEEDPI